MASRDSPLAEQENLIRRRIEIERTTHKQLSEELQRMMPGERGCSVRSLQRFCSERGICKTSRLSDDQLQRVVTGAIAKVGPTYGRKTMTGLLASDGVKVAQRRVGKALQTVNPSYQQARRDRAQKRFNPIPYHASHFGHKLHIDQNEKLVMYGVTHVCAIDGYSGKVVGFISMPVKNNVEVYNHLFRPLLYEYRLWDQIRVDEGKEWVLMLYIQEQLAHLRRDTTKAPHRQTTSKLNHTVERFWPEINSRVNYPIKACLVDMEQRNEFDIDADAHKFCSSWFSLRVANVGAALAVRSWNEHPIPGKGTPNRLMYQNNQVQHIDTQLVPSAEEAVQRYEAEGGHLTLFSPFGQDPLQDHPSLAAERERQFMERAPSFSSIFETLVNGNDQQFRGGLRLLIRLTDRLTPP